MTCPRHAVPPAWACMECYPDLTVEELGARIRGPVLQERYEKGYVPLSPSPPPLPPVVLEEKLERMRLVYERELALRAIALEEALAARKAGKRVPANRRYRDPGSFRSLDRYFRRGIAPWWLTKEEQ